MSMLRSPNSATPLTGATEVVPVMAAVVGSPAEALLGEYATFLLVERGLSRHTVFDAYVPTARLFLAGLAKDRRGGLRLDRLAVADVSVFVIRACQDRSVSGIRDLVSAFSAVPALLADGRADRRAAGVGVTCGRRSA